MRERGKRRNRKSEVRRRRSEKFRERWQEEVGKKWRKWGRRGRLSELGSFRVLKMKRRMKCV